MLINLSNHPLNVWKTEQINAANEYGEIVNWEFPYVDPQGDEIYIENLAKKYVSKVLAEKAKGNDVTVHIMGEMTLTYAVVEALHALGIVCIASTTERMVTELEAGRKEVQFVFKRFRKYV